jgi:DNA polymerase-3 subunit beta
MQYTIKTNELKALLLCAAKNDVRYYLNGVHFESTNNGIIAASTDGHRLLCINLPNELVESVKALIPRALIEAAVKTKAPTIDITIDAGNVTLSSMGQNVSGSLTEGVFPDYRRVIPEKVSGIQGNEFNNEYLVDFDKIGKLVNGGKASVLQNDAGSAALVKYTDENVIGVIMPFKHELPTSLTRPAWLELPLKAAA